MQNFVRSYILLCHPEPNSKQINPVNIHHCSRAQYRERKKTSRISSSYLSNNPKDIELAPYHRGHWFPTIPPYLNLVSFHCRKVMLRFIVSLSSTRTLHASKNDHHINNRRIQRNCTGIMSHSYHKSSTSC